MPPKAKDIAIKKPPQVIRPSISASSLNYIPDDALEGFQERIETGLNWTLTEEAARYHKQQCNTENILRIQFSEALQNKIKKSILHGFLDDSTFSLQEQWYTLLAMTIWDNDRFANKEGKICFNNTNSITDNMINLIKRAVLHNDREMLKKDLKMVSVLRVNDSKMTELDSGAKGYKNLVTLNLCGNFINDVDTSVLPEGLRMLELQGNRITDVSFAEHLPHNLIYLGLGRNFLNNDSVVRLAKLSHNITILDLSDNDIYGLDLVLTALSVLTSLVALQLAGNPCSVCAAYARTTLIRLPRLQWLDCREVQPTDGVTEPLEPHADDMRSAYFTFTVFRVMSIPQPPKPEKGAITAFHVELELPLLDSRRRMHLMYHQNESLIEMMPPPEEWSTPKLSSFAGSRTVVDPEASSHESDVYNHLTTKNSREICHFTTFESNRVQWNKIINFQEPTIRIFCPDLLALRDTFRTVVTVTLVYTVSTVGKQSKLDKKSVQSAEQRVNLARIKCILKRPDWSQKSQHFHWDDSLGTDEAIHWGDGDLSVLQYSLGAPKTPKGKPDSDPVTAKQSPPENLTCHFGFGIDTLKI